LTAPSPAFALRHFQSPFSHNRYTTRVVEDGRNLAGWSLVPIPATTTGSVTITPSATTDHVKVILPGPARKAFVLLKVSQ